MSGRVFMDNAKVMSKGQVTIPKEVREVLGVGSGDKVTFIVEGSRVSVVNAAAYAMQVLSQDMKGVAESVELQNEEDVMALVKEIRAEREK